jgi:hypothetical protein
MKNLLLFVVVLALLGGAQTVVAQEDTAVSIEGVLLPEWANQLAFGTVALSSFAWGAVEIIKWILKIIGVYKDGWGRYIVFVVVAALVVLALGAEMLDAQALVDEKVEWVYQLMQFFLALIGAPIVHQTVKKSGLLPSSEE